MRSLNRAITVGLVALSSFAACGESKKSQPPAALEGQTGSAEGGQSGRSDPEVPPAVRCGAASCQPIALLGSVLSPCCVNPDEGTCGAELDMLGAGLPSALNCQPLTQPGELDRACPANPGGVIGGLPIPPLPGCCRAEIGVCGYFVSDVGGLLPFAPGCIDSAPFSNGSEPVACGPGVDQGGGGGAAGAPDAPDTPEGLAGEAAVGGQGSAR